MTTYKPILATHRKRPDIDYPLVAFWCTYIEVVVAFVAWMLGAI